MKIIILSYSLSSKTISIISTNYMVLIILNYTIILDNISWVLCYNWIKDNLTYVCFIIYLFCNLFINYIFYCWNSFFFLSLSSLLLRQYLEFVLNFFDMLLTSVIELHRSVLLKFWMRKKKKTCFEIVKNHKTKNH